MAASRGGSFAHRFRVAVANARQRHRAVDRGARALAQYQETQGSLLAGAVTYYGLLSFFPILALTFAALGFVVGFVPDAQDVVLAGLREVLPGLVTPATVDQIRRAAGAASIIGLAGFLYSGLSWVSALREALNAAFGLPLKDDRNLVVGKGLDLLTLVLVGIVLVVSVGASSFVTNLTQTVVDAVGLGDVPGMGLLLGSVGILLGVLASTVLFFVTYRVLPKQPPRTRLLVQGALLAAVGFEVLKLLATRIIGATADNPLYGAFALIIALLLWINYFSRLTVLGACWAFAGRRPDYVPPVVDPVAELTQGRETVAIRPTPVLTQRAADRVSVAAGAVLGAALATLVFAAGRLTRGLTSLARRR